MHADDLARLIRHVDAGPATVFGTSGGAITTLAVRQQAPELVWATIAHDPPLTELLDDRDEQAASAPTSRTPSAAATWSARSASSWPTAVSRYRSTFFTQVFGGDRTPEHERYFYLHELEISGRWLPDLEGLRKSSTPL
jgi:pimeloyl-ACP methyl ester carboxylesterase